MKRPIEVTPICLLVVAVSAIGLFTYGPERGWAIEFSAMISSSIVFLVAIGFWCGDRMCHRLMAFFAAWAMIRPVMLVALEPPMFDKVIMLAEAGLALPLLIWLFSKRIDTFTRAVQASNSSEVKQGSALDPRP